MKVISKGAYRRGDQRKPSHTAFASTPSMVQSNKGSKCCSAQGRSTRKSAINLEASKTLPCRNRATRTSHSVVKKGSISWGSLSASLGALLSQRLIKACATWPIGWLMASVTGRPSGLPSPRETLDFGSSGKVSTRPHSFSKTIACRSIDWEAACSHAVKPCATSFATVHASSQLAERRDARIARPCRLHPRLGVHRAIALLAICSCALSRKARTGCGRSVSGTHRAMCPRREGAVLVAAVRAIQRVRVVSSVHGQCPGFPRNPGLQCRSSNERTHHSRLTQAAIADVGAKALPSDGRWSARG